jgi:RNA polymerase sigma-70 factor (ECF subfamily)
MSRLADLVVADGLIAAVRAGDRDAAGRLYGEVAGPAYTLARRLVGAAVAEDVLQDSMVRMFTALDSFRGAAPFGCWLRRIVVTQCLMQLRSPWRRARVYWDEFAQVADELTNSADPAFAVDAERALRRLTPTARAVLWLHAVEGYSHADIGAQFGRSESFSKTQLARALRRLRDQTHDSREEMLCQTPPKF